MLLIIVSRASVVLELGLNAYCVGDIRLWWVRCSIIWIFKMVSSSLILVVVI